jgi:uncharacterized protein YecE (DUF72 family)
MAPGNDGRNQYQLDSDFSVKAPRTITHEARLICGPEVVLAFLHQINFLGDKLGPVLIQLPPSLAFEPEIAQKFLLFLCGNYSGDVVSEPRPRQLG